MSRPVTATEVRSRMRTLKNVDEGKKKNLHVRTEVVKNALHRGDHETPRIERSDGKKKCSFTKSVSKGNSTTKKRGRGGKTCGLTRLMYGKKDIAARLKIRSKSDGVRGRTKKKRKKGRCGGSTVDNYAPAAPGGLTLCGST